MTDPAAARAEQRIAAGKMSINGVDIAPPGGIAGGRKIIERRASLTAAKIREALRRNRSADSFSGQDYLPAGFRRRILVT